MTRIASTDCLIVGGGVVGLSVAYELASNGRSVRLLEREASVGAAAPNASWAGAGVLPPGSWYSDDPALEELAAASRPLHRRWSDQLRETTGVDDEFSVCGALYAAAGDDADRLAEKFAAWRRRGIEVAPPPTTTMPRDGERLAFRDGAYFVPAEAQVRNPRRLRALRVACERLGVEFEHSSEVVGWRRVADRVDAAITPRAEYPAGDVCLASGARTGGLAGGLAVPCPTEPVRGQMLLLRLPKQPFPHIVHHAGRYLVPRRDGRVLVGSTVEKAGFDPRTTPSGIEDLRRFAFSVAPCLREAEVEASWAGLRPGSADGLPMIGRLAPLENAWVASGHYRSGLQFAPATAVAVRQRLDGEDPGLDLDAFSPGRYATAAIV